MRQFIKDRWQLLALLIVFIALKAPHLFYPYIWDESWPYVPAIFKMYHHGVSLIPGAVEPELSRGHPLFFHAMAALWMNIFGKSHLSLHCFALFVSLSLLVSVYEAGLKLFNKRVAFLACLLVASQAMFFIQSSFLLPEILMPLLCFAGIFFYVRERYILAAISLSAAFYTKESALMVGFVIGIDALVKFFNKSIPIRKRVASILVVGIPVILIGIFFLLQKKINGWYIFPLYDRLIENNWTSFFYKFRMGCLKSTFMENYRYYTLMTFGFLGLLAGIKLKNYWSLAFVVLLYILWNMMDDDRAYNFLPGVLFVLFIISLAASFYSLDRLPYYSHPAARRFVTLCFSFFLVFTLFSATNCYINRYLLTSIVPLLFVMAVFFEFFLRQFNEKLYFLLIPVLLFIGYRAYKDNHSIGDTSRNAFRAMEVERDMVRYCEKNNLYDKHIATRGFLNLVHLTDPNTGFLSSDKAFSHVRYEADSTTEYVMTDNIENIDTDNSVKHDSTFEMVYEKTSWEVWTKLYKKKGVK